MKKASTAFLVFVSVLFCMCVSCWAMDQNGSVESPLPTQFINKDLPVDPIRSHFGEEQRLFSAAYTPGSIASTNSGATFPKNPPTRMLNKNNKLTSVVFKDIYPDTNGEYIVEIEETGISEYREFLVDWYMLDLSESINTHRPRRIVLKPWKSRPVGNVFRPSGYIHLWRTGLYRDTGIKRIQFEYISWWAVDSNTNYTAPIWIGKQYNF